ncbi:HepT-like ribonuclease domain-containing protein [Desulfosporosinus sp. OT]|uniref:HepT-like ribonuclease domain-containing protein n=1 Tax=Desulfosporosinus sp. OT TaxID=913865 RepID=UPI000223A8CF|nr:HepT-like ribonuclease domain-containing protein [Desulfosporosinus sp. OT]EGW39783.1 hypothetical protein DOT_1999 [Desulfosporosinus sp. OT]
MRKGNDDVVLIEMVLNEITDIESNLAGVAEERFMVNSEKQIAVCLSIQNISNYCSKISDEIKKTNKRIDWINITGLRNVIAHEYGKIKMSRVYSITQNDLSQLDYDLKVILTTLR